MKLTDFCIRRPITTGAFFTALMILGFISTAKMPIDLLPQVTYPSIFITTDYTGAGPEEVERLISVPVERAVSTINGVKSISSDSSEGSSRVRVEFDWGVKLDEVTNDIRANVDRVKGRLPDDASPPTVRKYDPNSAPIMTLGLSGKMDQAALRFLAEDELSYILQRAEGVANVDVRGGKKQEIRVYLKQDRLQSLGLTSDQVVKLLGNENTTEPAGSLAVGVGDFLLRTKAEFKDMDEIRNLVVTERNGTPIYLKDVATVVQGYATNVDIIRVNGDPGVIISVYKRSGMNTVATADQVYKMIKQIETQYPQVKMTVLNDDSVFIRRAVRSVADAAVIGAFLAALILLFFFHNFRATMITGVAIPISILTTLMLAFFNKITINTISLGALALGVGMLVDNAVVVLDNIFRHEQRDGVDIATASLEGTAEMTPAITASTLTHICVFFPLLYLSGRTGVIFKELAYMVIFSILCSLLVAVTLIPMLCAKFLKVKDMEEIEDNSLQGRLVKLQHGWEVSYESTLAWCIKHKSFVLICAVALFIATTALYPFIGTELVQVTDEGAVRVGITLPTGTIQAETDMLSKSLEAKLTKLIPEARNIQVQIQSSRPNRSEMTIKLEGKDKRKRSTQEIVDSLQETLKVPGARVRVSAPSNMRRFFSSGDTPIQVDVRGYDLAQTQETAIAILDKISTIPGIIDADYSREEERPELAIVINRKRAADYGISATTIAKAVKANIEGDVATIFRKAGQEIQIRVNLQESDRKSWQDLGRIMVSGSGGRVVPLASIIELTQTNSPVTIERIDQERNISVTANIKGLDLSQAMKLVQAAVSAMDLPYGVKIYYGGDYKEQVKSAQELTVVLILALLLIYMVMAAQFESFFDPFVIMLAVPFALGGVFLILLLTDTLISSQVYIGLIMLGGVVVNNTIVLISYIRILIERGIDLHTAVLKGARARLRPIVMTTGTTILGLMPLAIGLGEGSETQFPLARTVIGGLTFSSVLSLILIPVIFIVLEDKLSKFKQKYFKPKTKQVRPAIIAGLLLLIGLTCMMPSPSQAEEVQQLTVTEAVTMALQNSETAKYNQKLRATAEAEYRQSVGENGLQLSALAEVPDANNTKEGQEKIGLEFEVNLSSLAREVAEYNRTIALLAVDLREEQLIYSVITAFQRELLTKHLLELAQENYQRSERIFDEIQTRSKLGLTSISDEIGAESQKVTAQNSSNRSRQLYQLAGLRLRQLLNLSETKELRLMPPTLTETEAVLESLNKDAQAKRADLKQGQLKIEQAAIYSKLAKRAENMNITLDWSVKKESNETTVTLSNSDEGNWKFTGSGAQLNPDFVAEDYSTKLVLKWKFWDGRASHENTKQAKLLEEELALSYQQLQKTVNYEVKDAFYSYTNQLDQARSSEIQLRYAKTYFEATQAKLRVGLASVKDLLDAQILLHEAESDDEQRKSDLYLARINLLLVTGKLSPAQKEF